MMNCDKHEEKSQNQSLATVEMLKGGRELCKCPITNSGAKTVFDQVRMCAHSVNSNAAFELAVFFND